MDYFNELLESYRELKKRTFKLRYISEEDNGSAVAWSEAEKAATTAIEGAPEIPAGASEDDGAEPVLDAMGQDSGMVIYKRTSGKTPETQVTRVNVKGRISSRGNSIAVVNPKDTAGTAAKNYKKFIDALSKPAKADPVQNQLDQNNDDAAVEAEEAAAVEAEQQAQLAEPGGLFNQELEAGRTTVVPTQTTKALIEGQKKALASFCETNKEKAEYLCGRLNQYFSGEEPMGFEYKLVHGQAKEMNDAGKYVVASLDAQTVEDATRSHQLLISAALVSKSTQAYVGQDYCGAVTKKIGLKGSDSLVLFTDTKENDKGDTVGSKGVVISPMNQLQRFALDRIKKNCGTTDEDLRAASFSDGVNSKQKNAIKGTMYEETMSLSINLNKVMQEPDSPQKDRKLQFIIGNFVKVVLNKKETVEAIWADMDKDGNGVPDQKGAMTQEALDELETIREEVEKHGNVDNLRAWIMEEIENTRDLVSFMEGDSSFAAINKTPKTGGRDDMGFIYSDKVKAEEKAGFLGSEARPYPPGTSDEEAKQWAVGVGQKRLVDMHGPKVGEMNGQERMTNTLDVGNEVMDSNIEPGFWGTIGEMQYGPLTGKPPNQTRSQEQRLLSQRTYATQLEATLEKSTASLLKDTPYIAGDKISLQTPLSVFASLGETLKDKLGFADQKSSPIFDEIYEDGPLNDDGTSTKRLKDFNDKGTRERAREAVKRICRFDSYRRDLTGEKKEGEKQEDADVRQRAAQDTVVRTALVCGANARDLAQVITSDDGQTIVLKHQEVFKRIAEANNAGPYDAKNNPNGIQIEIKPGSSTATLCVGPDFKICTKVSQERSQVKGKADTRTLAKITRDTLDNPDVVSSIPKRRGLVSAGTDLIVNFLKGQQQLLETLIG